MSIKILVLKSGEDVLADVQEMVNADQQVFGYLLSKPVVVKLQTKGSPTEDELNPTSERQADLSVTMFPWMPLARETSIPLTTDWVVTMITPVEKIQEMYEKDVLKKETNDGKDDDQVTSLDDERDVGLTD